LSEHAARFRDRRRRGLPHTPALIALLILAAPEEMNVRPPLGRVRRGEAPTRATEFAAVAARLDHERIVAERTLAALRGLPVHQWDSWLAMRRDAYTGAFVECLLQYAVALPEAAAASAWNTANRIASALGEEQFGRECRIEVQRTRAVLLVRAGRYGDAVAQLDAAAFAAEAFSRGWAMLPELRLERAEALLAMGEHARAQEDAAEAYGFFRAARDEEQATRAAAVLNMAHSCVNLAALVQ
jgi:tetratricopeptide (TPR) repeat protein